jgi:hypothetical protein
MSGDGIALAFRLLGSLYHLVAQSPAAVGPNGLVDPRLADLPLDKAMLRDAP